MRPRCRYGADQAGDRTQPARPLGRCQRAAEPVVVCRDERSQVVEELTEVTPPALTRNGLAGMTETLLRWSRLGDNALDGTEPLPESPVT